MPQVSVIIPAHNAGRTITAALESVFAQTYRDYDVVVVDDGSTDETAARVAEWGDKVLYVRQENRGPASARNEAIRHSSSPHIAFLDADDVWMPRKLERQVAYFARFPETGLLHSATLFGSRPTDTLTGARDATVLTAPEQPPASVYCALFHGELVIYTLTVMARRDVVTALGGFDERRELHVEDWDLWLRIAAHHPVGYLPHSLAIHRPGGSMSSQVEKTYGGQKLVIAQSVPLCRLACSKHAEAPDACLHHREYRLYAELGYERFWSGRLTDARTAYARSIALQPTMVRPRLYHAATFAGQRWLGPLGRVRRALLAAPPAAPPTLTHDTTYRRTRAAMVRFVHRLDDAVSAIGRTESRVLFEAASPLSLAVFRPVLELLRRDARIQMWFTAGDGAWDPAAIFGPAGITERVVTAADAKWMKFDAYINTDFWNMTWLPRRTARIHLFHGVAGKYGLDAPTRIAPVVAAFQRLMFPNRDRLQRYAEAGLVDAEGPAAALIGYPKVDCLVDGSLDRREILRGLELDPTARTVLYAPTWSPHSSLNAAGESIIASLARLGGNVIVKLHDRSYDRAERGSGGIDWRTRIERICNAYGAKVAQGYDASPYLYAADALVTDHSSVGFEFMLLDRPVVIVDCAELLSRARVSRQKAALLRSAADVVDAPRAGEAVRAAMANPIRHSPRRRAIAADLFYDAGRATARAAECIYDALLLSPPVAPVPTAVDAVPAFSSSTSTAM
jgi:glycosyltransferase involved in cell wall biosynthesis